ncbi:thiamine pyrophosphate-requiring protein [Zunongwangia sp. F363]|uniref:Thiamine pyrophosphate-requiring protein n=1 Tax=Autumnicola tepida TaxID=3075595 RepID=A0ABU3C6J9_9FLAO|nr:thiamine pyrophosphate-requiring protein [Zunongwangia sp. F363]MDT0641802.1 thiamine pyrophosphate-requiring protein [Zunongwangia sp. F363]
MSATVSDFILQRLNDWGVKRIYGYPGDGINALTAAVRRAEDDGKVEFIQTRHEEMAAFMAGGHAKFTGEVGICMATSGPGAVHLLNGLYDAKMDHQPVVAFVGQQARMALGGDYQQEIDLMSLFKDVAGEYVHMATVPEQVRHLIDRALRIAISEKTVTCVILPNDLQELDAPSAPPRKHGSVHSGIGITIPSVVPHRKDLERAAEVLNEGKKVAMLIGSGARNAADEVTEVANLLGAGVAKALLGKDVLPDDLPFVTGSIGLLGTNPSYTLMDECDTLLMIGTDFPYSEFLPKEGQAKAVQIDIEGKRLGTRYPTDVNLVGDSKDTLAELIPMLKRKEDRDWREKIEKSIKDWWEILEERAMKDADPINPQRVFWELSKKLPDDCILTSDSGSSANWYARDIKIRKGMRGSLSGKLATMCPGVPYAIAAKFAHPEKHVIALVGDGAMQMLGNNGLITISKYWDRWNNGKLMILVLNNRDLNQVTWEQRVMTGNPKYEGSQKVPDFPYAEYASMLGLKGIKVDKPEDIEHTLDEALSSNRPVIYEAYTDPEVPPMPPHVKPGQAKAFVSALLKGDPESIDMIKQSWKDVIAEYTH